MVHNAQTLPSGPVPVSIPAHVSSTVPSHLWECPMGPLNLESPKIIEALQVLKFQYNQARLDFTTDLVADELVDMIFGPITAQVGCG